MKHLIATLLSLSLLAACATNPVTGRKQFMIVPESQAIAASREAYVAMLQPLKQQDKLNNNPELVSRVNAISSKLVAQAIKFRPETKDWQWTVNVIDDPQTVNAFCMAGGRIAVYSGLIQQVQPTDAELAEVLGHEMGHALSNHTAEQMSIAMASDVAVTAIAATQDSQLALSGAAMAAALAVKLPNSRKAETEADRIGIELAARAGYDPRAAISLWEKMEKVGGNGPVEFLSTHPSPGHRIESLKALVPQMTKYYQQPGERPVFPVKEGINAGS